MRRFAVIVSLVLATAASVAYADRVRGRSERPRATPITSAFPGTALLSSRYTYAWPTAGSCVASPNWNPMPAVAGGTNANMPLSATNTTYTCSQSTFTSDPNDLFGHESGLLAEGIGTNRINDAFADAAAGCWINLAPTGYSAITEGTNFLLRIIFRPTTTSGTKNMFFFNSSASEYIRASMATAVTWTIREGASGNQTITWTPPLQNWHMMDFVYVSDCNGDAGNPCVYLYTDGQLATGTGGGMAQGVELGVNMADFGAAASVQLMCDPVEAGMFNGTMLFVGMSVGSTMSSWFGTTPAQFLAQHRADCQATGICSAQSTVEIDLIGQSLSQGFNATATNGVTVTAGVAQATVATNHGIRVGDRVTTTALSTNDANSTVSAIDATHVSYNTAAGPGAMADGIGVITLNAHSLVQSRNFRECRNNATLPLLIEGTAGAGAAYESPLYATAEELASTFARAEQFVGLERGYGDTSILENNNDTLDGSAATTNYDQLITWITDCESRVGGQGSTIMRHIVNYDQGEGSGDAPGADYYRPEWNEYFAGHQEALDTNIKSLSGQSEEVTICFNQTNSWTDTPLSLTSATIAQEQLTAHEQLSTGARAYLTGPKYQCRYSDGTHLTGVGYDQCSACLLSRCDNAVLNGTSWSPTRPTSITCNGTSVTVNIYTPVPPLVIDTTNVTDPSGASATRGFEYTDTDNGSNPTITGVNCSAACTGTACTCVLTMSSSPCALDGARIRYAFSGTASNDAGPTTGARGNVRDSQGDGDGSVCSDVSNWLVAFDKPITRTFVDDTAWNFDSDGSSGQEECDAADGAGLEAANNEGQTATGLVVDVWIKPITNGVNDRNIVAKGSNSTHSWSLITETAAAGYWLRFGIEGVANFFEFGTTNCGTPFDDCTSADHTTPGDTGFTLNRWTHAVCSIDLSHGTIATSAVTVASNVATATVLAGHGASAGQCIVTTGHTTNTPGSPNGCVQITSVGATSIVYALTAADGPLADGVGTITDNDLKIRCFAAQCDASGSSPTCTESLTEKRGVSNATMPAAFVNNSQPLRVGGFGSGTPGQYYYGGEIGEIAFWYSEAIDDSGLTHTHRSYNATEVRTCLETATTHKPVDHAQVYDTIYLDTTYKSCNWPQFRAWYRMGGITAGEGNPGSGTTLPNSAFITAIPSGVAGSLTCTNNTGTDMVSDSID